MDLGNGLGHLTYSTLVHPADDWPELWTSLNTYLPKVKARFAGNNSFGVCIRLSAKTAQTFANSPAEREKLKNFSATTICISTPPMPLSTATSKMSW